MHNYTLYLAGGFKSGWQTKAKEKLKYFTILDPSEHGINDPKEYTLTDLEFIRNSDVILAYMERDNPGGYALSLEIGYAKALGKITILVEEHPIADRKKYFSMVREAADFKFNTLDEAIIYIYETYK